MLISHSSWIEYKGESLAFLLAVVAVKIAAACELIVLRKELK